MDINDINRLDNDKLLALVNYIEGMPQDICRYVKIHINDITKRLSNNSKIQIDERSSLLKYLKNNYLVIKNADNSFYQSDYCNIVSAIMNTDLPYNISKKLLIILDMPCYSCDTYAELEVVIADFLDKIKDEIKLFKSVSVIINRDILPYKSKVYDLYTRLELNDSGFEDISHDFSKLHTLTCKITKILSNSNLSFVDLHDIAILINLYYNELGIDMLSMEDTLLNRFIGMYMFYTEKDQFNEDVNNFSDNIKNNYSSTSSTIDLTSILTDDQYDDDIKDHLDGITSYSIENDGYIYFFNGIMEIHNMLDEFTTNLKILNKNTISEYIPESDPENIQFYISDNDIGHLKNNSDMRIGSATNVSDMSTKYFCFYNNTPYLLFKLKNKYSVIYGISLTKSDNQDRQILTFNESNDYHYKFISTI